MKKNDNGLFSVRQWSVLMPSADGIAVTSILSSGVPWSTRIFPQDLKARRTPMKIAIYVRVSTQRQAQTQTIEQQLQLLREHSQAHNWPWSDEHIFRDDGYSGASLRRPGLDRFT